MSDCILWDADYESGDLFLDRPPEEAKELRKEMRIAEDYYPALARQLLSPGRRNLFSIDTDVIESPTLCRTSGTRASHCQLGIPVHETATV